MKVVYSLIATCLLSLSSMAQLENPWVLGAGWNGIDDDGRPNSELLKVKSNWVTMWLPNSFHIEKVINSKFSVEVSENANSYDIGDIKDNVIVSNSIAFIAVDATGKFHLNSLYNKFTWFDPYIAGGTGITMRGRDYNGNLNIGFGATFWLTKRVGLSWQSLAKFGIGGSNYIQHTPTVKIKVPDKKIEKAQLAN